MGPKRWARITEVRRKLRLYVDVLWDGRKAAADVSQQFYTERLANAARVAVFIQDLPQLDLNELRELMRRENAGFPKALLATESGRAVRSAFNLLAGAVEALEEDQAADGSLSTGPETLVGAQLASVAFVNDYFTLDFHGLGFHVSCPVVLHEEGRTTSLRDPGFRDRLCGGIGLFVRAVEIDHGAISIKLDGLQIELVFASEEAAQPEPLIFYDLDRRHFIYVGEAKTPG
jgi:hypothetical protein